MSEVAQRHGVHVLQHRLCAPRVDRAWFRDPVHPTFLGYRVMAEDLAAVLIDDGIVPAAAVAGPNNTTAL
jgi:lysophospholipase L1-like esterase